MEKFAGKILIIGCGSVAQCVLTILFNLIEIKHSQITVLDLLDKRDKIKESLEKGVNYVMQEVLESNYVEILSRYLSKGDFLLDLSVNIETRALMQWCHDNDVLFLNTSVEIWNKDSITEIDNPQEHSLYMRHVRLQKMIEKWDVKGPTAIIEHGANPGLVSHFTKQALLDIAKTLLAESKDDQKKPAIQKALDEKNFPLLAKLEDIKVIHISERDTQISELSRGVYEFVNTWSCDGLIEEAAAPAELGIGTHEEALPANAMEHSEGLKHQILLGSRGCKSIIRSWVPSGPIAGMIIRHGEAYTLCESLSVYKDGKLIYRPTVHYAYEPCGDAMNSLKAQEKNSWSEFDKQRILEDEIVSGQDELGCLLMGHEFDSWWIGSILDIHEARKLAPHQNATTVQVAIGVIAAMIYAMQHPKLGFCTPDDLDHDFILKLSKPYLGTFISRKADFHPPYAKKWQLTEFLL